jgi:hypothetical protein
MYTIRTLTLWIERIPSIYTKDSTAVFQSHRHRNPASETFSCSATDVPVLRLQCPHTHTHTLRYVTQSFEEPW